MSDTFFTKNNIMSAVSNLSAAYNLVVINIVHVLVENQYCGGDNCKPSVTVASTAVLVGAIVGQLTFGYLGDCIGRARALQLTMALTIGGALASAFAVPITSEPHSIFTFLAITRFVLGLGVGGVYPLSATIASESSESKSRGRNTSLVFSMQGVANCLSPLLAIVFIGLCGTDPVLPVSNTTLLPMPGATPQGKGLNWRFVAGLGALPGILLIPFKVSESKAMATQDENSSTLNPTSDDAEQGKSNTPAATEELSFMSVLQDRKYWPKLMGTAGGWFLFDITFYGNSLFQSTVLRDVFNQASSTTVEGDISHNVCLQMLIIALMGLPGYYVSVYFMDTLGRRNIQLQGFLFMALTFAALGIFFDPLKDVPGLMMILYGLTFFFSNFGPNSTTFVLPAETFPKKVRTTLNGFSAAMGKAGATLGSSVFKPLSTETSVGFTMIMCAVVSLLGFVLTWFCVEDRRGKEMEDGSGDAAPSQTSDSKAAGEFTEPLVNSNTTL